LHGGVQQLGQTLFLPGLLLLFCFGHAGLLDWLTGGVGVALIYAPPFVTAADCARNVYGRPVTAN